MLLCVFYTTIGLVPTKYDTGGRVWARRKIGGLNAHTYTIRFYARGILRLNNTDKLIKKGLGSTKYDKGGRVQARKK